MRAGLSAHLRGLVAAARAEGRSVLTEPETLEIARRLGLGVPRTRWVRGPDEVDGALLDTFPGARVVVKVVSPEILHKSDVGGVRFVSRDVEAVRSTIRDLGAALSTYDLRGFLLVEFVWHDPSLGGQLLLGVRNTPDFGPVVTLGPGGVHAEFLAQNLKPGRECAILSPLLSGAAQIEAALEAAAVTPAATGRLRGQESRVSLADLRDLVARFLDLASEALPDPLVELEINPLVWTADGPVALDAFARLGTGPASCDPPRPLHKLPHLLSPRTLAIVGVSQEPNPGRQILENLLEAGFPPAGIWVVKPDLEEILGCRCVPAVSSLPGTVDLLVVCLEAGRVPDLLDEVVAGGHAQSVILIAGGLGERRGTEVHEARVRQTLARARSRPDQGPIVNGGNCLGVRSVPGRLDTLFIPRHKLRFPETPATPLAIVSQSGALAVALASKIASLNPRVVVTLGNQLDLTVGDYLVGLQDDPDLEVYACYVEGFRPGDGARWVRAAQSLRRKGKAVLLYRAGRTAAGAEATRSHTASVAGDYAVTRALAEAAGAVVAESLEDLTDLVRLFCLLGDRTVTGRRLGALSNAGFEVVAMADHLGSLELASFTPETRARLERLLQRQRLESIVGVRNLLDLTPITDDAAYEEAVRAVLADPHVDVGVVGCVPLTGALQTVPPGEGYAEDLRDESSIVRRLIRLHRASRKAWVGVVDAGPLYDPMVRALLDAHVPTFRSADRALRLFGRYVAWRLASADG